MPLIWAGIVLAGIYGTGWTAGRVSEAFDEASDLTKVAVIGGGLYVGYRVAKAQGVLK